MAVTLEDLQIRFTAEMGGLNSQLNGIKQQLGGVEGASQKTASKLGMMAKAGIAFAGVMVGRALVNVGQEAIQMANDVTESESLFQVSMGDMADSTREWSKELQSSLGISEYAARKNVGVLNTMFKSMGLGKEPAAEMSKNMVELANDMASFYNLPVDEAFAKLRSGITGEQEPLKQLGILVDEATVKTYALRTGMIKEGQTMTAQQKVAARYGAIIEQTGDAQGDLARTMDSPTNQLRRMSVEMDNAKIALGQALQPALLAVLPVLTNMARGAGSVIQALSGMGESKGLENVLITLDEARKMAADVVGTGFADIAKDIEQASKDTDKAIADFETAEHLTKNVFLAISFNEPTQTGYELVTAALQGLKDDIYALDGSVNKYIVTYLKPLLTSGEISQETYDKRVKALQDKLDKLKANAAKLESKIDAKIAAAMKDEKVTEKEKAEILKAIETEVNTATKDMTAVANAMKAQIAADLKAKKISPEEASYAVALVDAELATALADLTATADNLKATVGIGNWNDITLTQEQTDDLSAKITASINAANVVVSATIDEVKAEFTETGAIGLAVGTLYERMGAQITEQNGKIAELIAGWTSGLKPTPEQVKQVLEAVAARDRLLELFNPELGISGAATMALGNLNLDPDSINNYFKAINEAVTSETAAAEENFATQKIRLANAAGFPEWDAILASYGLAGMDYDAAVKALYQQMLDTLAGKENTAVIDAAKKLMPSIAAAIASGDVSGAQESVATFLKGIDFSKLDEAGRQAALDLIAQFDLSPMGTVLEEQLLGLKQQLLDLGLEPPTVEPTPQNVLDEVSADAAKVTAAATPDPPVVDGVGTGVTDEISTELTEGQVAVKTAADGVATAATPVIPDTVSLGESIPNGLITGMDNKLDDVKKKATELASAAISAIKLALLVGSPSKITTEIGGFFGKGFANGIINSANLASRAAAGLANGAINALNSPSISTMTPPQSVSTQPQSAQGTNNATFELVIDGEKLGKVAIKNINDIQRRTGRAILNLGG